MWRNWAARWLPKLAIYLFWPAIAVVAWGELTPHPPNLDAPDKFLHFLAYFGLSGIATIALNRRRAAVIAIVALIALGGALEILQSFTGRDAEWLDEAANALGAILGGVGGLALLRLVGAVSRD